MVASRAGKEQTFANTPTLDCKVITGSTPANKNSTPKVIAAANKPDKGNKVSFVGGYRNYTV